MFIINKYTQYCVVSTLGAWLLWSPRERNRLTVFHTCSCIRARSRAPPSNTWHKTRPLDVLAARKADQVEGDGVEELGKQPTLFQAVEGYFARGAQILEKLCLLATRKNKGSASTPRELGLEYTHVPLDALRQGPA